MRLLLLAVVLCLSTAAHAGGKLVGGLNYIDDVNQVVAPTMGIQADCKLLGLDLLSYVGGGVIPQPEGSTNGNTFARAALDVSYGGFAKGLAVGVGGGLESAKSVYKSFDDYVHIKATYDLW